VATGRTDISFTLPRDDGQRAMTTLQGACSSPWVSSRCNTTNRIGKVSLIGAACGLTPGERHVLQGSGRRGVNIEMISTSEFRISVVVDQDDVDMR
jgi:aspartate kinase